ncbi:glutathione S-transferase [Hypoxylon trugodes]|uniref:glutathione S-transferase n=1 Tax=Hypoxylon trugodes TaxID=326681 RepID=UPI00218F03A9|nr:glutathione S-transferase [Hypoxylon trugodes]KAI1386782.1 glutathione S-transferase [Hypoxylon trugodes]
MAPFGKIYSYPGNYRVERAQVIAAVNGLEVPLAEGFKMGVDNKTPEFLAKFPMGRVPAFEGADGFCLAEGGAIATYLALSGPKKSQLLGSDPKTQALVSQWVFFAESDLNTGIVPPAAMAFFKMMPYNEERYNYSITTLERCLKRLEVALEGGKKYLVGDALTLADVMVAGILFFGTKFVVDAEMRKDVPNVVSYLQGLSALPEFKALGELTLVETRAKP